MQILVNFRDKTKQKINQLVLVVEKNSNKFVVFLLVVVFAILPLITSKSQKVLGVDSSNSSQTVLAAQEKFIEKPAEKPKEIPKPQSYAKAVKNEQSDAQIWKNFDLKVDAPNISNKTRAPIDQNTKGKLLLSKNSNCGFVSDKFGKNTQLKVSFDKKQEFVAVCEIRILPPDVVGIVSQDIFQKFADPTKTQQIEVSISY